MRVGATPALGTVARIELMAHTLSPLYLLGIVLPRRTKCLGSRVEARIVPGQTIRARGKRLDHGIGWFRKPADVTRIPAFVEHYGTAGGLWNAMRIYPEDRLALVAMANTTAAWNVDRLYTQLKSLPWA